jgi:hypothetical protein
MYLSLSFYCCCIFFSQEKARNINQHHISDKSLISCFFIIKKINTTTLILLLLLTTTHSRYNYNMCIYVYWLPGLKFCKVLRVLQMVACLPESESKHSTPSLPSVDWWKWAISATLTQFHHCWSGQRRWARCWARHPKLNSSRTFLW